jgi:hypothetical protein
VFFGFDRYRFYVRLDAVRRMVDLLAEGLEISLTFLRPEGVRFVVTRTLGRLAGTFLEKGADGQSWVERGPRGSTVAAGTVVEMALPLRELDETAGAALTFFVAICDAGGNEVERHPAHQPVQLTIPDERFEARNWTA